MGLYNALHLVDLDCCTGPLPLGNNSVRAVTCVGVLSYIWNFTKLFTEWCRVTSSGGIVIFTHRQELWDGDVGSVRSSAKELEVGKKWVPLFFSEPEAYMPRNPAAEFIR